MPPIPDLTIDLNLTAAVASALAAVFGVFLLIQNTLATKRQSLRDQLRMVGSLSERWEALRDDWNLALLTVRGPDAYYLEVDAKTRLRYRESRDQALEAHSQIEQAFALLSEESSARGVAAWLVEKTGTQDYTVNDLKRVFGDEDLLAEYEELAAQESEHYLQFLNEFFENQTSAWAELSLYKTASRRVLRFFSEVSGQVLRGLVDVADVYEAFGPEIARNGGAIRELLQEQERGWAAVQPGLVLRISILVDLMWARGAELGELATQPAPVQVAEHKRTTRSGVASRQRAIEIARKLGSRRVARKVRRQLKEAESPAEPLPEMLNVGLESPSGS